MNREGLSQVIERAVAGGQRKLHGAMHGELPCFETEHVDVFAVPSSQGGSEYRQVCLRVEQVGASGRQYYYLRFTEEEEDAISVTDGQNQPVAIDDEQLNALLAEVQ